ncbi:MAG: hypothetical protein JWN53_394 [Gemmatimonadetes bacterium]|jgi:hypothetical protein|nr:hypothetical protein [Gemmatimonadota bacterium]
MAARRRMSTTDPLERVRALCLSLPEAHEVEAWGEPTFRVRNKMFAMFASATTHHGQGRPSVWCKSTPLEQDLLLRARPDRYFSPPYVGPGGWVGIFLDRRPSWTEVADILEDGWRLAAPKKLLPMLDESSTPRRR